MQVEIVQHKKYHKSTNFCAHAFVLPNDEFRPQYQPSIKQSVTHFKIKHTHLKTHISLSTTHSNMPNQL
jgi:hypothetical protein